MNSLIKDEIRRETPLKSIAAKCDFPRFFLQTVGHAYSGYLVYWIEEIANNQLLHKTDQLSQASAVLLPETDYDLLEAAVSLIDDKNHYITDGYDGFPSFGFRPGSEVKQPYRMYLPEKLPAEFTLVASFKPLAVRNSYLFAVLNPFETVVQLGIRISVSWLFGSSASALARWFCRVNSVSRERQLLREAFAAIRGKRIERCCAFLAAAKLCSRRWLDALFSFAVFQQTG